VQSMAVGLPVVTSPTGAHPDLIEDGVTGRFADGDEAWIEAIDGLVRDADTRRRMGAAARAAAEERFSIEAVAPALEAALRHAAGAA
jgi:glycosyltransferase involved in cell wall biosynthesis